MTTRRILVVTGIFPPDVGGPARYVPQLIAELSRRGHQVRVVCLSHSQNHDDSQYECHIVRIRRQLVKPWRWAATVWTIARWSRLADVVFVNGLGFEALVATTLTRVPCVHKIVGDPAWERARNRGWFRGTIDEYQRARKGFRLRALDWIRTVPLRRSCRVVVPSRYLRSIVANWGVAEDRIAVIYNALKAPSRAASGPLLPPFHGHTLITICRLVPWKGVEDLVRLACTAPDWRLVVVGDGPLRQPLEELSARLGVQQRVILTGGLPNDEVASLLGQADVFVLNSSYEGLPHTVVEAMQAGVPVVATNAGGTPEIVLDRETGLLVPVGEQKPLQDAVTEVLTQPGLADKLATRAQERLATTFSYEQMIMDTEKLLLQAARKQSQRPLASRPGNV